MIGAVIIKHKLCLSDRETVAQIQENPYLQYFVGLPGYQMKPPFAPSLFVEIRKRMGATLFDDFHAAVVERTETGPSGPKKRKDKASPADNDKVAEKAASTPEQIAKQKRPTAKVRRKGIKQQLQYLRRNLKHIEGLLEHGPQGQPIPLPRWLLYCYWVIQHLYAQQWDMYLNRCHRCDDRIVSISQPYVRPIVRGKLDKSVEFGAKLSVSLSVSLTDEGIACVDEIRWDAFHEGKDLVSQVEAYKARHGYYPEVVLVDPAYGSRANRGYLKQHGIRFGANRWDAPKRKPTKTGMH